MAAAKKAVAKKAAPRAKKVVVTPIADVIYWVLSGRTKLFNWEPIGLYTSYDQAATARDGLEELSPYSLRGYKVSRVELVSA